MSRFRHLIHALAALLFLTSGLFAALEGLDRGLFSTGRNVYPVHPAAAFLDEALDDLIHRSFETLSRMEPDSRMVAMEETGERFRLDLRVSRSGLGMIEIQGILTDPATGLEVDRLTTYCIR